MDDLEEIFDGWVKEDDGFPGGVVIDGNGIPDEVRVAYEAWGYYSGEGSSQLDAADKVAKAEREFFNFCACTPDELFEYVSFLRERIAEAKSSESSE